MMMAGHYVLPPPPPSYPEHFNPLMLTCSKGGVGGEGGGDEVSGSISCLPEVAD